MPDNWNCLNYYNLDALRSLAQGSSLPSDILKQKWADIGDITKISDLFDAPKPVMYIALASQGLI